jgi:hypothetical protein
MRATRIAVIVSILTFSGAACTTSRVAVGYKPSGAPAVSSSQGLVEVGAFADKRGEPSNWLGAIRGGFGNPLKNLESDEPVSDVVTHAFADGLKARGLLASAGGGRYALSGTIRGLACDQMARREASADLQVVLRDTATGQEVLSKGYKAENIEGSVLSLKTGVFASVEDLRVLIEKTLQQAVDSALDDPAFRAALGEQRAG